MRLRSWLLFLWAIPVPAVAGAPSVVVVDLGARPAPPEVRAAVEAAAARAGRLPADPQLREALAGRAPHDERRPGADEAAAGPASIPASRPASSCRLEVRSEPAAAQVLLDRTPAGRTPLTLEVPAGAHRVVVTKDGFAPWRRDLEVARDLALEVALAPRAPGRWESLARAAAGLRRLPREQRVPAALRLGREAGAGRVLAFEVHGGRLRAQLLDAASGARLGGLYEEDARAVARRADGLAAHLDGATSAGAPGGKKSAGFGRRWWHWALAAGGAVALGFAIYQSSKGGGDVTFKVVKP
jgi:hypothetical protein